MAKIYAAIIPFWDDGTGNGAEQNAREVLETACPFCGIVVEFDPGEYTDLETRAIDRGEEQR